MHLSVSVKALDGTPVRVAPTPAMLQRLPDRDLDPGRGWAGDLYDTGDPSDPEQAYARFTGDPIDTSHGPEDVEAWIDRSVDGTLIGWVRQGDRVWRYTDPAAWALDVDGADMTQQGSTGDAPDPADSDDAEQAVDSSDGTRPDDTAADNGSTGDPVQQVADDFATMLTRLAGAGKPTTEKKSLRLVVHPKA